MLLYSVLRSRSAITPLPPSPRPQNITCSLALFAYSHCSIFHTNIFSRSISCYCFRIFFVDAFFHHSHNIILQFESWWQKTPTYLFSLSIAVWMFDICDKEAKKYVISTEKQSTKKVKKEMHSKWKLRRNPTVNKQTSKKKHKKSNAFF